MPRPSVEPRGSSERGFTLIEIMTAIAILVFGVVSLVGLLGVGVATHRSAEQHDRAVRLAERVLQRIEEEIVPRAIEAAAAANEALTLPAVDSTTADVDGFPGLRYRIEFTLDPEVPTTALCKLRVLWLDQGEAQAVEFHRILVSHVPFPQRIARLREGN